MWAHFEEDRLGPDINCSSDATSSYLCSILRSAYNTADPEGPFSLSATQQLSLASLVKVAGDSILLEDIETAFPDGASQPSSDPCRDLADLLWGFVTDFDNESLQAASTCQTERYLLLLGRV